MLTRNDWANTGWRFMRCLELLGLKVEFLKGAMHRFGYPEQAKIYPGISRGSGGWVVRVPALKSLVESAHIIHFIASTFIDTGADLSNKHVVVQHGGSTFRRASYKVNNLFNPIIDAAIIQCPDLLGLGAKNEVLIYYPVDVQKLQSDFKQKDDKILIGHFPRSPGIKGTVNILEAIKTIEANPSLKNKFKYVGIPDINNKQNMHWEKHLKRVNNCDVIIETCNLKQGNNKYGEWANTAIEAASLGKIVITNTLSADVYKKEYGGCALHIANTVPELVSTLSKLVNLNKGDLLVEKQKTRNWVVKNHSMEANAVRLWEKVYNKFFDGDRKMEIQESVNSLRNKIIGE